MKSNPAFHLEPDSPADRAAKRESELRRVREANRRAREAARAAGQRQFTVTVPEAFIEELDALRERVGVRTRSEAVLHLWETVRSNPDMKQELGL